MNKLLKETLIGIDHGEENTGVALGRNGLVSPLKVVSGNNEASLIHELVRIAIENKAAGFIVGLPLDANEKETKQSIRVRKFAKLLKTISKKPVKFQNEHGSTMSAITEAINSGISQKGRRLTDHLSAALILKDFYRE